MANLTKIYSDIDFTFTKKPVIGDVALSYDDLAVIRSIRNLLLTKHYERPFNPDIGSNIDAILFEPISPVTATSLEKEVELVIKNYEKRAKLKEIIIVPYPRFSFGISSETRVIPAPNSPANPIPAIIRMIE